MEKVKRKKERRHTLRNLPLKWSFMLYVLVCAIIAITISLLATYWFSSLRSDLYYSYEEKFLDARGLAEDAIQGDAIMDGDTLLIYRTEGNIEMTPEDRQRYVFYNLMVALCIPVISLLCILLTGIIFYNRKLKEPLHLFDDASSRIASGDLDFSVHYDNRNEMGKLARSFETMRSALLENHREMWRMMEQRKQLNAAFAHDLRTPLTVLRGYTEYLQAYVPQKRVSEEKLLSTVQLMHAYVTRLEGYTTSMSNLQNLEEVQPHPKDVSFANLCARLQSAANMLRGTHRLRFDCEGEGSLCIDPNLVTQVLENLVSNASRYARAEICTNVRLDGKTLRVTVSDDGPGFSAKMLSKGIAPYNRRKDEEALSEHYGLGLYICSVLCERHGGSLALPTMGGSSCIEATFAV